MKAFDGRPLIVGTIRGVRSWTINSDGRLWPRIYCAGGAWGPEENTAICHHPSMKAATAAIAQGLTHRYIHLQRFIDRVPTHRVAGLDCECGFYAFFDGSNEYHSEPDTLAGIIEGHGTVTAGTKGFRAEKAKIVALVDAGLAPTSVRSRLDRLALATFRKRQSPVELVACGVGLALYAPFAYLSHVFGALWVIPGFVAALTPMVALILLTIRGGRLFRVEGAFGRHVHGRQLIERVKERYPDVQWFPSMAEALRAYPVKPIER